MAYELGRILERDFGFRAIAVATANDDAGVGTHVYDLPMPIVSQAEMLGQATRDDVVIVNPSFSDKLFGWRTPAFKICYVQAFHTYPLLDLKLDHFVAVSDFIADYLRALYGLSTRVIPPFINLDRLPPPLPWRERPEGVVLAYCKGMPGVWRLSYQRLREAVAQRAPEIKLAEPIPGALVPQREFLSKLAAVRYFLTLSAAEGFGLVPLEAMALGTVVIGYDGYGGRQYMRAGENCAVAPYPDIDRVIELLIEVVRSPEISLAMSLKGQKTAAKFGYEAFRSAWVEEFRRVLPPAGGR